MVRKLHPICCILALLTSIMLPIGAVAKDAETEKSSGEKVTDHGRIDWEKGTLYATGLGLLSNEEPNQAKAYLRARSFAKMDALRNLLMLIDHVKIDSQTLGSDFEAKSDEIRAEIKGIVRGAQVVSERHIKMGNGNMLEVTVSTAMYGDQGIAGAFIPEIARHNRDVIGSNSPITGQGPDTGVRPVPLPEPQVQLNVPGALSRQGLEPLPASNPNEPITSLIIDARGQKLERCMAPKIRRVDGNEVWGTVSVDPEYVVEHGIVVYAHSVADARRNDRAGSNPLWVRAVGRSGGAFNSDPVLADEDVETLVRANAQSGFLKKFRVIFIVDQDK